MPKKTLLAFVLLALTACFLSYKVGSSPVALAKSGQDETAVAPPPLPTAPGTWVLTNSPTTEGAEASVTKAAGGTGVKHVVTCISASIKSEDAGGGGGTDQVVLQLRDGAHGSGAILQQWYVTDPPTVKGDGVFLFSQCDLNIVGSANTPMTLQFASGFVYFYENVNLVGYDAN